MALSESSLEGTSPRATASFAESDGDCTIVWLRGEHDASTVAALSETMARTMALDDTDLVVDLSEVEFMGAATVGVLLRTHEFLQERSRSMTLRSPSPFMGCILDLCGLGDLVDPGSGDARPAPGAAAALGTWVEVPASARAAPFAAAARPEPEGIGGVAGHGEP